MAETYTVTVEPLGREVQCAEDQPILDACLRAGVWLPHSCTHGTCATCKVDVLDGDVDHGASSSFALMDFERDEGKTLTCCALPQSDVTIEADIEVDDELEMFPVQDFEGTIVTLEDIATGIKRLVVKLDGEIGFNAGQYMRFRIPGHEGIDRTWSIASPPTQTDELEFHVALVPGGIGTEGWLFADAKEGDRVQMAGPYGRFVLRTWEEKPVVMLGGGTGLEPLAAMIKHALLNEEYEGHITLYAGARAPDYLYDLDLFRELEEEYPDQFTFNPCVDTGEGEGLRTGYVSSVMEEDFERLGGYQAYICGSPAMVEGTLKSLMSRRLFPRDIFHEDFFNEGDKAAGVGSPLIKR
ncbi:MAG: 2Fe-2S iron-sulfur cluster binding domain-containing protein [Propionibacterium sp.]|nr:2Fe-2S iron-sulfur cluster binding domain-containing protein [Propionibacterium sp.]